MEFVKVSSFVDLEATGAEKTALLAQVQEIIDKVKAGVVLDVKLGQITGSAETLKTMGDLSKNTDQLAVKTKAYEKTVLDANKATKQQAIDQKAGAKAAADASNDYKQLSLAYNEAALKAKNYSLQLGANHPLTVQARNDANAMGRELKSLDAQVGQHQRNVGDYSNAITKAAGSAFGVIRKLAYVLPGIGIAGIFSLIGEGITNFVTALFGSEPKIDAYIEKQKKLNASFDGAKDSVVKAIEEVSNLRIAFDQAEKGVISKEQAVKLYNETIGKTTGLVTSLDQAEKELAKNADAYIQFTLLKAVANYALQQSAKATFDAVLKQREALTLDVNSDPQGLEAARKGAKIGVEADKLRDQSKTFLDIQKDFQAQADEIAKKFHFNFFGDTKAPKEKQAKALADFKKGLIAQATEAQKLQDQTERERLRGEADLSLEIATNEKNSFDKRYQAYLDYYKKIETLSAFNTQAELAEAKAKTDEEKRQIQDKLDDKTKKLTTDQRKDLQATLVKIDEKAELQKKEIIQKANLDALAFDRDYEKQVSALITKSVDEQTKKRLEAIKKLKDALQADLNIQNNTLSTLRDEDLVNLNHSLAKQEISVKEYNKERLRISKEYASQELDNQIFYYEKLLKATATTEEERRDIEAKIAALRLKKDDEITNKKIDNLKKLKDKEKELAKEAFETFKAIVDGGYDREKNAIQDIIDALDLKMQKDIEVANATSATTQEAADRVAVIQARAAAQKLALEKRQRQIDEEKARFDKVAAIAKIIADTASAVVEALPDVFLASVIGAIGALQLARVIATPIPHYKTGLDEAKSDHVGMTGDGGRSELVVYPDGSSWITPDRPTLTWLPKGSQVIPSLDEAAIAYNQLAPGYTATASDPTIYQLAGVFKRESRLTRQAILNKRETYFSFKNGEISMRTKDGYNETVYLNQNLGF